MKMGNGKWIQRWTACLVAAALVLAAALGAGPADRASAANAHGGDWSLRAAVSGSPTWKGTTADLSAAANTSYVLRYWIYGSGKITAKVANSGWTGNLTSLETTASGTWTQVTQTFNSGLNTTIHLQFQDTGNTAGTLYIDDVYLGVSGGANLVSNGGFESGSGGWYIPQDAAGIFSVQQDTTPPPPNNAHTGSWSAKAVVSGTPTWNNFYQQVWNVPANTDYTASVWVKGTGKLRLRVVASSNWNTILREQEITATSAWTQYSLPVFNTGSNSGVVIVLTDGGQTAGTLYIDDAFLGAPGGANKLANAGFESGDADWGSSSAAIYSIEQSGSGGGTGDGRHPFLSGVYEDNSLDNAEDYETWIGRDDFYLYATTGFDDWDNYDSSLSWLIDNVWEPSGKDTLWNVPLITTNEGTLAQAADGDFNDHYLSQAQRIAAFEADEDVIYVRNSWEFNGYWFPWTILAGPGEDQATKTQNFIGAYRQFVDTFRSVSDKFRFEWNVNIGESFPLDTAYPGDAYVDLVGMDVYDKKMYDNLDDDASRFQYLVTRPYGMNWLRDFARQHGKGMSISEWGVGGDGSGDSPLMVESMFNWFNATGVDFQLYWDSNNNYAGQLRPTTAYPNAAAKYWELFGSYTGPSTSNTAGNVIAAVTSPGGVRANDASWSLSSSPAELRGIALDPDGNANISQVTVTVRNAAGQYLNQATHTFGSGVVYNPAVYDSQTGYWTLSLAGTTLSSGSGEYAVRAYANDGADSTPGISKFTR